MAKFLNTSATTYLLEELIKNAKERIYIVSPYLKLNEKIKELLDDKNRLKIDVRIIYGKTELNPQEMEWLSKLEYIRLSFCKNLHAKCYMSESVGIITSLNMYEFSQVNNNEMGVLFHKEEDRVLYKDCLDEVQRIIRISEEVRMNIELFNAQESDADTESVDSESTSSTLSNDLANKDKVTTRDIAKHFNVDQNLILEKLVNLGFLNARGTNHYVTDKARQEVGAQVRKLYANFYFLWDKKVIDLIDL